MNDELKAVLLETVLPTIDIIVVEDYYKQGHSRSLLTRLKDTDSANLWTFSCTKKAAESGDPTVWTVLNDSGSDLVRSLRENTRKRLLCQNRPLLTIGVGIGGLVLKRAIARLKHDNFPGHQDSTEILKCLQGIVLLGVPHITDQHSNLSQRLTWLLRSNKSLEKKALAAERYVGVVRDISKRFEETRLNIPVISACENNQTKIKKGLFKSSERIQILGRPLTKTFMREEEVLALDTDYFGIFNMAPDCRTWRSIKELINKCRGAELSDISSSPSLVSARSRSSWSSDDIVNGRQSEEQRQKVQAETKSFSSYEDVSMTKELERSIPCPEMPCYLRNPHGINPNFMGRDDVLRQVDDALLPSKNLRRRTFSLCGFGGIGKTEIAVHYAFTREKAFDAIFWVEADQATKLGRSFDYIAKGLGLFKNTAAVDHNESRQAVIEWLEDPQVKVKSSDEPETQEEDKEPCLANWLLIFDNAERSTDLEDYWPKGHYGSILITSRDPEFISVSDPARKDGLTLVSMTSEDCAQLLLKLAQQPVTEDSKADAKTLIEKIHRVPLAIRQLAALIRKERITVGEFLQYYGSGSLLSKLDQVQGYTLQDLYRLTISTVWRLETFKPEQTSLLNKMAMMDPSQIDESILDRDITCGSITDVFPRGLDFVKTRTELLATSLIDRNSEIKALSTHRLVQEVAMEKMDHSSLLYNYTFVAELLRSSWHFKTEKFDREGQRNMDNLTPHIINLHGLEVDFHRDFPRLETQRALAVLFQECAWYLTQHGQHPDAGPLFDTARDICQQNQPELDDELATTLFALARWGVETGADANEVLSNSRELLEIRKQNYDISCKSAKGVNLDVLKDLATAHTGMAQALLLLDRYQEAFDSAQRCIDLEAVLPEIVEGKAINQFAMIYQALALFGLERYDEAAKLMDKIIAFRVRQFGSDDKNSIKLGLALQVLGQIYFSQGRYEDSRVVNVKALENYIAVTGNKNYYRAAQVCLKLAECHVANDEPEAASQYFERAISTYKHQSHLKPDLARAYFKKAMFRDRLKQRLGLVVDDEEDDPRRLAVELYSQLKGEKDEQKLDKLGEDDFNKLVRIFSR